MNISDFTYILQNPVHINAAQTKAIEAITKEFPYFQAARVVHLKGLKNQDSFKYNQSLKTTAAYTTDRSILFDFITSKKFEQHKISSTITESQNNTKEIEVEVEEIKIDKNLRMEDAIKTKLQEANAILDPELFQPKATPITIAAVPNDDTEVEVENEVEAETDVKIESEVISEEIASNEKKKKKDKKKKKKKSKDKKVVAEKTEVETLETEETPEQTLELGKPLSFDKKEKHSFSEWLQLTNLKPIDRSDEVETKVKTEPKITIKAEKKEETTPKIDATIEVSEEEKQKRFELIDKFIDTNPKIKPKPTLEKTINLANDTSVDQSMLMTETLAKVYLEQKKYRKAIKAYDILILKYPEKSGFFADQIRAIKKLQQNN
ncbi:tetratricopeptide repeat protein [Kordia algicida OT-1]|uniref:Tetratricopeptide repeat protein n=1 Tax=Kordia algicida OT-1 TaxID=391587 RepID=A9DPL7_9FLAO|nr:tetratricopeptide repeat protein [Kordia algicida]EDP97466.1 hypothetical protein KAOT1_19927 [Kordia algicida OT-1]